MQQKSPLLNPLNSFHQCNHVFFAERCFLYMSMHSSDPHLGYTSYEIMLHDSKYVSKHDFLIITTEKVFFHMGSLKKMETDSFLNSGNCIYFMCY